MQISQTGILSKGENRRIKRDNSLKEGIEFLSEFLGFFNLIMLNAFNSKPIKNSTVSTGMLIVPSSGPSFEVYGSCWLPLKDFGGMKKNHCFFCLQFGISHRTQSLYFLSSIFLWEFLFFMLDINWKVTETSTNKEQFLSLARN